jgi:hypothetical protein
MYKGIRRYFWKKMFDVVDRSETQFEAMTFSDPTPDCSSWDDGSCWKHHPVGMVQIFAVKVARIPADAGSVELYGYIAVRDELDPRLNYVVNISRDDPIVVEQGSLVTMAGPKRGIVLMDNTFVEYDMRIKRGQGEQDDLQVLDGASIISFHGLWNYPFTLDTPGDYGTIDIILSFIRGAVEATVEVHILEVQRSFNLFLICLTSGLDQELMLFDGAIAQSRSLKRCVVAVTSNSFIDLKFNVGEVSSSLDQHCCSFKAEMHGHVTQKIRTGFALILVKVTWSTVPPWF